MTDGQPARLPSGAPARDTVGSRGSEGDDRARLIVNVSPPYGFLTGSGTPLRVMLSPDLRSELSLLTGVPLEGCDHA